MKHPLVIGSRGSKLALWQAEHVQSQLKAIDPTLDVRIDVIKTTGDVKTDPLTVIGGKGVFTKELEDALLAREVELAVHSMKDVPTDIPAGLAIPAICKRVDVRDCLVARKAMKFVDLPRGARVGSRDRAVPRLLADSAWLSRSIRLAGAAAAAAQTHCINPARSSRRVAPVPPLGRRNGADLGYDAERPSSRRHRMRRISIRDGLGLFR